MFWRFGFANASTIDGLLDREDVALEAILDEDELLQECKSQNTRLIDYFQRLDVLQRLLGYVTGEIEGGEGGKFKYPYVAAEVLCSEIWSIVEACLAHPDQLLGRFWETVLDRPGEDMKTQMVMASHFAKINATFLSKKPAEMLAFIQAQPRVVERLLRHIETPSIVDLLVRIIQLDEHPAGAGVLEWLSAEHLISRLVDLLSPEHTPDIHTVVSELVKGIISMAAPSPGAGLTEGSQNGPASNRFARELAQRDSVAKLVGYILNDFSVANSAVADGSSASGLDSGLLPDSDSVLPNMQSATSSVVHSISVVVELIRKNNSDYFEPYLFHTLRNRLIHVQQQQSVHTEDGREALERAMKEMVDRMGVVHLGPVLEIICERLDKFQGYLRKPRSMAGPVSTTVGEITPLTFERYRICELYAELLHCSNMALLNRSAEYSHLYDAEGRLQGGLSALEDLARVIAIGSGENRDQDALDASNDEMEPAQEFPVSDPAHAASSGVDSDEDMSDEGDEEPSSSDDDGMDDIVMDDDPATPTAPATTEQSVPEPFSPHSSPSPPLIARDLGQASPADSPKSRPRSAHSRRSSRRMGLQDSVTSLSSLPVGERLKQMFLQTEVLPTVLDLFFQFPWNNFVHSVVYDLVHQILTGRVDTGLNRDLILALFRDAHLMQRIVDGQKRNDMESAKPKGVRLGYMGHLTLMSEDVISALEHYPPDLRVLIAQYAPRPDWEEYVTGRYHETKKKDSSLLGGGKPVVGAGQARGGVGAGAKWKVDEAETPAVPPPAPQVNGATETRGEFRRAIGAHPTRESSADFGPAPSFSQTNEDEDDDDDDDGSPHFTRYLAQEMQSSHQFESGSSSDDDEEDEGGGWLVRSTFEIGNTPAAARHADRRPLSVSGFDDTFGASSRGSFGSSFDDPFSADDDDAFGPFSDSAAASGSDPFTFASATLSEEIEDATSFDSFGDFGDFHSGASPGREEATTPTAETWSFTSGSSRSSADGSDLTDSAEDFGFGLRAGLGGAASEEDLEQVSLEPPARTANNAQ